MRVLVCGGRDYRDAGRVLEVLDRIHAQDLVEVVIHGCAPGADELGRRWAEHRHIEQLPFPPDWAGLGRAAGPRRNQMMLEQGKPDLVVAFPGGHGTADMVRRARAAGVEVLEVPA